MEDIPSVPEQIIHLVGEDRKRNSDIWRTENEELYREAIRLAKEDIKKQLDQQYLDKKQELLDSIFSQFRNLMNQSSKEIEAYVKNYPSKKDDYQYLLNHKEKPKKKKDIALDEEANLVVPDLEAYLSHLSEIGIDIKTLTLFAEDSFLYHGKIFEQGQQISIACRNDRIISASLDSICQEEIVLGFNDNTCLRIKASEIESGKIHIICE